MRAHIDAIAREAIESSLRAAEQRWPSNTDVLNAMEQVTILDGLRKAIGEVTIWLATTAAPSIAKAITDIERIGDSAKGVARMAVKMAEVDPQRSVPTLQHLGDMVFRMPPRYETPGWGTVLALAAVVALSAFVLERRVRGVEVVT